MPIRVEVALRMAVTDTQGNKTAHKIKNELGLNVDRVRIVRVYTIEGLNPAQISQAIDASALHDPVLHTAATTPLATDFDWIIEVGFRPGVTDNEGRTAKETLRTVLGDRKADIAVYTSTQYLITADLSQDQVEHIAKEKQSRLGRLSRICGPRGQSHGRGVKQGGHRGSLRSGRRGPDEAVAGRGPGPES